MGDYQFFSSSVQIYFPKFIPCSQPNNEKNVTPTHSNHRSFVVFLSSAFILTEKQFIIIVDVLVPTSFSCFLSCTIPLIRLVTPSLADLQIYRFVSLLPSLDINFLFLISLRRLISFSQRVYKSRKKRLRMIV